MPMNSGEACACDNWICPHNEEKIAHLPGVVKGVAWLKGRVEEMRKYWQEAEASLTAERAKVEELRKQLPSEAFKAGCQKNMDDAKALNQKLFQANSALSIRAEAAEAKVAALTAPLASMTKERDELREVAMNGNRFTIARAESAEASLATRTEERDSYLDAVTLAESELAELRKRIEKAVEALDRGCTCHGYECHCDSSNVTDAWSILEAPILASPPSLAEFRTDASTSGKEEPSLPPRNRPACSPSASKSAPPSPAPVESKPKAFHECGPGCYATPPAADTEKPSPDKV